METTYTLIVQNINIRMREIMTTMQIGELVKLATMPELIFKIIKRNTDGSYEVAANLGNQNISYGHIAPEMLRRVTLNLEPKELTGTM